MNSFKLTLLATLFFTVAFRAQTHTDSARSTHYDAPLAKSLGADQYGMKNYILVLLKTGPKDAVITDKTQREVLFKGHFSNMKALAEAGKLVLAGPFATKNELGFRGLFLLDTNSIPQALELLEKDPTIKAKIFEVELLPFYGSAAIPTHLEVHKNIEKVSP